MHRFFTKPENITDRKLILHGSDVVHIRTVLRLKNGDRIQVLDGCGNCYTVTLVKTGYDIIESRIDLKEDATDCESPFFICLGQSMVKGTGFDGIVRRASELGVGQISPLSAIRCVSKLSPHDTKKKNDRWQKIAREAAKQCGRSKIPLVSLKLTSVKEFCFCNREADLRLIFWEEEESIRIKDLHNKNDLKSAAILVGPEGGFASSEIKSAKEYGFQSVSLGPRLLRTDTAALAVLSILQNYWGDL